MIDMKGLSYSAILHESSVFRAQIIGRRSGMAGLDSGRKWYMAEHHFRAMTGRISKRKLTVVPPKGEEVQ